MNNLKIEIKWSILYSLVSLLWMTLEKVAGLHDKYLDYHMYLTNLFLIPAIWMFVLALKEKKKIHYNGNISYGKGLLSGFFLSLFIALLSPLTQWVTSFVISPDFFANAIKRSVEIGYFKSETEAAANFNYQNYAIGGAIGSLIFGVVITLIAMIFIQTKKSKN